VDVFKLAPEPSKQTTNKSLIDFYLKMAIEKDEKGGIIEKLEVTVIPVDDEPYSKIINITPGMISKCNITKKMNVR
jgi:hypothetical protein